MVTFTSQISILLLLLLSATTFHISMSLRCNEKDRGTLLLFKQGIIDRYNYLSTWSKEEDCCAWKGVQCENITGRVTKLELGQTDVHEPLTGEINLYLLKLEFLNYLDLSFNEFDVISIPPTLEYITSASNLHYLDLSYNFNLQKDNLHWLSPLSSLKYLNLGGIDLHKETNWLQLVAMLPSLLELRLSDCKLNNISTSLEYVNFTSLVTLDLSDNNFNSELPYWLFNLSSGISHLELQDSNLHGEIPSSSLSLRNLKNLDLSWNDLTGSIPNWFSQLEHLQHLDLSNNLFSGSLPSTIGNLSSLVSLRIGSNSFSGAISETSFSKLSNLEYLDLSNSTTAFHFNPEWIPLFQLHSLFLSNTKTGPNFPPWIYTQKSLRYLYISSSGISTVDGDKFRSLIAGNYWFLDMSNNSLSEDLSNVTLNSTHVKLDHNNFKGGLPHLLPKTFGVDFSYNSFLGSIPLGWKKLKILYYINLWSNRLSGEVLVHLSNLTELVFMDIGKNEFSGTIPIKMPQKLQVMMILRSNHFEGDIPSQLFNLSSLYHLDVANNKFSGSLPQCVYNMTQMVMDTLDSNPIFETMDLFTKGNDYEYLSNPHRRTIDLSDNNLSEAIPSELFGLIQVQTLNLSHNHFTGKIEKTIGGMENMESLDLSNNNLSGEIPQSMAVLSFLGYLNLSYNNFIGQIPTGTQLQSFDASSFIGNLELCGAPLSKCITQEENPKNTNQNRGNEDGGIERESLYLGMGVGFAVGFWGICGSFLLIRKWRHAYYQFLDYVGDELYVMLMVKYNNFRKRETPAG
ncbi:receptor-like protein EIX2 [Gastrolobium bilobum]|uniref:receptor-like protein EIX2 n=1 Tax=Gastrolobium bilobum TaxID=150636 RepID=UPI002AAF90F6|nr:receptor-like protein EIX2 [Gastrolobium bilobum]